MFSALCLAFVGFWVFAGIVGDVTDAIERKKQGLPRRKNVIDRINDRLDRL